MKRYVHRTHLLPNLCPSNGIYYIYGASSQKCIFELVRFEKPDDKIEIVLPSERPLPTSVIPGIIRIIIELRCKLCDSDRFERDPKLVVSCHEFVWKREINSVIYYYSLC
ncbi:uncharacterized protein LOC113464770 [Ceratina calcarata]|uniref:Uncharacterized protein LOC113464770 n=1 Tax=Ceratina calcarata TaxID=156304 RepID=A0AAJ7S6R1_9HYME|nr:uncharacterized protein LOC113464770 [Ceratina calcarata]